MQNNQVLRVGRYSMNVIVWGCIVFVLSAYVAIILGIAFVMVYSIFFLD